MKNLGDEYMNVPENLFSLAAYVGIFTVKYWGGKITETIKILTFPDIS